jgi:hypothetical protein
MLCVRNVASAVALLVTLVAPAIASAQVVQHSGDLLDVDAESGIITLAEIAPGGLDAKVAVITVWMIAVPADTAFFRERRVSGDVRVEAIEPWAIAPGDFAVVDCLHRNGWLIALRIVIVEDRATRSIHGRPGAPDVSRSHRSR